MAIYRSQIFIHLRTLGSRDRYKGGYPYCILRTRRTRYLYKGGLVFRIYEKTLLSVQTKDVRINFVRITNHAEGVSLSVHIPITKP